MTIKMKGQQEYLAAIDLDYFAVYSKEEDLVRLKHFLKN